MARLPPGTPISDNSLPSSDCSFVIKDQRCLTRTFSNDALAVSRRSYSMVSYPSGTTCSLIHLRLSARHQYRQALLLLVAIRGDSNDSLATTSLLAVTPQDRSPPGPTRSLSVVCLQCPSCWLRQITNDTLQPSGPQRRQPRLTHDDPLASSDVSLATRADTLLATATSATPPLSK